MNIFQPGDLAMIIGHNSYWDGCVVKIKSVLGSYWNTSGNGHICEIAVFSPAMMDPARRPSNQKIGYDIGAWDASFLEIPRRFSALCTACKGNSFCEVIDVTETRTVFECKSPSSHAYSTPYCSLDHDVRTAEEAKWLTPTSKWAWHSLAPPSATNIQPTIEYPKATPEPQCQCDIFNFGCSCQRLTWENSNE